MLKFILGTSGSGKTAYIQNRFAEYSKKGEKKLLMLVPDQSSFAAEKAFFELLGPRDCRNVQVLGFSRLCDYVFEETGIYRKNSIDEGTRKIIMSMALEQVQEHLELYGEQSSRISVLELMVHAYKECQKSRITPRMLLNTSDFLEESVLKQKLREIALVLEAYEAVLSNTYIDPLEDLTKVAEILPRTDLFAGYRIALDSFSGFTAQQTAVLECLLQQSRELAVLLTLDERETADSGVFATTADTKRKLCRLAEKNGIAVEEDLYFPGNPRFQNEELLWVERNIFRKKIRPFPARPQQVVLAKCRDIYGEVYFVSQQISKLVMEGAYRYRDIAVICRSSAPYAHLIRSVFDKNGIPCFLDDPEDIYIKPVIKLVCALLETAVGGFERETVLSVLKTGLTDVSVEDTALFENYLFTWDICAADFKRPFTENPSGFSDVFTETEKQTLQVCEKIRGNLSQAVETFKKSCADAGGMQITSALYALLVNLHVPDKLSALYDALEAKGQAQNARRQVRVWNLLMDTFDRMAAVLGETKLSLRRYYELLKLQFQNIRISDIPQSVDSVIFGDAQRIRLSAPKAVFIVGAQENEFPGVPHIAGAFSDAERKQLILNRLPLQDTAEEVSKYEKFLAYTALTAPSQKLYVSFYTSNVKGETLNPSEIVFDLLKIFPKIVLTEAYALPAEETVWNEHAAFALCAKTFRENSAFSKQLIDYFLNKPDYAPRIRAMQTALENRPIQMLDPKSPEKLFGENLRLSASQVEKYSLCAFQYFCTYGLRVRERRCARIDALEFGTLIHYFLESFFSRNKKADFSLLEDGQIQTQIAEIFAEYAKLHLGGLDQKSPRFLYLYERMQENAFMLAKHICAELAQSDFKPVDFELNLGKDVPAYTLKLPSGRCIAVQGSVDRVDLMEKDGSTYIRIVDYKTGTKEFKLCDVLSGLNLQMLLYLHTILENGKQRYGSRLLPAGILYMPAASSSVSMETGADEEKIKAAVESKFRMNGLLLNSVEVIRGMDKSENARYIPVKLKSGVPSSGSIAELADFGKIFEKLDSILREMGEHLYKGDIAAVPVKGSHQNGCEYCIYGSACNYKDGADKYKYAFDMSTKETLEVLRGNKESGVETGAQKLDK